MASTSSQVPTTLLPELLGFSPQLLLDDIITTSNESIGHAMEAMEKMLESWADERSRRVGTDWDANQYLDQALFAFQTLLESHTDIAFDFFEAWSLRNIFAVPADLPLVAPHQKGLDLSPRPEEETELLSEIEELRRKVINQRRLKRTYTKALRLSRLEQSRSTKRVQRLDYLRGPDLSLLQDLPQRALELFESVSALPHLDPSATALAASALPDPAKRQWEASTLGYQTWAVQELLSQARERESGVDGSTAVGNTVQQTLAIGQVRDVRAALRAMEEQAPHSSQEQDEDMVTS